MTIRLRIPRVPRSWRRRGRLAAILLALALVTITFAGCDPPTAPTKREPVCREIVIPAVTQTVVICAGAICFPDTIEVEPERREVRCQ